MTLQVNDVIAVPEETSRVARATFPKGNVYMKMRDQLNMWYKDSDYAHLFESHEGRPAESPGRLNLVLVMQHAEGLSDQQTAEAVCSRIDWKYALGLELTDTGFNASVLSRHRQRLIAGDAAQQLLDDMLKQYEQAGLLKGKKQQRTDSTHILGAIRKLNRLECLGETLRLALNRLAVVNPAWLVEQVSADWFELYGPRFEQYRLPTSQSERHSLAEQIGRDGSHLLSALYEPTTPAQVLQTPAVEILRQVWVQQFRFEQGQLRLREAKDLPPAALRIQSPYDVEARASQKRQTKWTGYKVHLTETCAAEAPHLITHVETSPATTPDGNLTTAIHQQLDAKALLPTEHIVDAGYVDADELVKAKQDFNLELLGPVQLDTSWQAKAAQGFAMTCFSIDWEQRQVRCPQGQLSRLWSEHLNSYGTPVIDVRFDPHVCGPCPTRSDCTRAKTGPRCLKLKPQAQHIALLTARHYQTTASFKARYNIRAGVEATISQAVRAFDLRRTRFIGLAKTHLGHILTAAAINLTRAVTWLQTKADPVPSRLCPFKSLAPSSCHN